MKSEEGEFSHIDENGKAVMVDVGAKEETDRTAIAAGHQERLELKWKP